MRKTLFLGLVLFANLALAADSDKTPRKLVLSIDGDWWDSSGQHLGFASALKGKCVFGKSGSLQLGNAQTKTPLKLVYEEITPRCPDTCPARPKEVPEHLHCADTNAPGSNAIIEASGVSSSELSKLFDRLFRSPQLFVVAAARGLEEEPQEAVLPFTDSEVDLGAALEAVSPGTYAVKLERLSEADGAGSNGKVSWVPGGHATLTVPQVRPGLYQLNIAVEGGESEGSDAWVLVCSADRYQADVKEFQQLSGLTKSWGDRVDASGKRALLRAALQSLADRDAGK